MDSKAVKSSICRYIRNQRPPLPVARAHRLRLLLLSPNPSPRPRCCIRNQSWPPAPRNRAVSAAKRSECRSVCPFAPTQLPAAGRRRIHPTRHLPALRRHRCRPNRSQRRPRPPLRPSGRQLQPPHSRAVPRARPGSLNSGASRRPHSTRSSPRGSRHGQRHPRRSSGSPNTL